MPRRHQHALDARLAHQRAPTAGLHVRQVTRLPHQHLALAHLVADAADVVDDVLTAALVRLDVCCGGWERDEGVAFAAAVDFVVRAGVDFGGDFFGVPALRFEEGVGAGAEVGGESDLGEEGVGGDGA